MIRPNIQHLKHMQRMINLEIFSPWVHTSDGQTKNVAVSLGRQISRLWVPLQQDVILNIIY